MNKTVCLSLSLSFLVVAACGSGTSEPDDTIPCPSGDCGKASFRAAVPSRNTVRIDFQRSGQRLATSQPSTPLGVRRTALEAIAPAYVALGEHVDEINTVVEELFAELEGLASTAPELEDETIHRWRRADPDVPGNEEVLTLESNNETDFVLAYASGPAGFEPAPANTLLTGDIRVESDGSKSDFTLVLDFDIATDTLPELGLTGQLEIRSLPFAGGLREIRYDFADFGDLGGELENSITTYWIFGENESGALEFLDSLHDSDATVYARWEADGGRLDYHVQWFDPSAGTLDEISTDCWSTGGQETFMGWALIDQALNAFVETDGDEGACDFGPLEGHPNPGDEFDNLPEDGEWDDLFANSVPFCEDDPGHPECLSYCDLFPEDC